MQTFLPSKNFMVSAQMLDSKRLNKQILEGYQILKVLSNMSPTGGWRNHPAVKMWRGHEKSLFTYVKCMIQEAKSRGIRTEGNETNLKELVDKVYDSWGEGLPEWFFDSNKIIRVTTTHRANLFKKDPMYYVHFQIATSSPYNAPCCSTCQYYWVTHEDK